MWQKTQIRPLIYERVQIHTCGLQFLSQFPRIPLQSTKSVISPQISNIWKTSDYSILNFWFLMVFMFLFFVRLFILSLKYLISKTSLKIPFWNICIIFEYINFLYCTYRRWLKLHLSRLCHKTLWQLSFLKIQVSSLSVKRQRFCGTHVQHKYIFILDTIFGLKIFVLFSS